MSNLRSTTLSGWCKEALGSRTFSKVKGTDLRRLHTKFLNFLFFECDYQALMRVVEDVVYAPDVNLKKFSRSVLVDGYHMKNVRYWILKELSTRDVTHKAAGVFSKDVVLLSLIRGEFRRNVETMALSNVVLSPKDLDRLVLDASSSCRPGLSRFVHSKLRFLTMSGNHTLEELLSEVMFRGVQAVYRSYPRFETYTHCCNIFNRAARNHGLNMIERTVTEKRSSMVYDPATKSFLGVVMSASDPVIDQEMSALHAPAPKIDLQLDLQSAIDAHPSADLKRCMVVFLGGIDLEFSDYCRRNHIDNNVPQASLVPHLMSWRNLPVTTFDSWMYELRSHLRAYAPQFSKPRLGSDSEARRRIP